MVTKIKKAAKAAYYKLDQRMDRIIAGIEHEAKKERSPDRQQRKIDALWKEHNLDRLGFELVGLQIEAGIPIYTYEPPMEVMARSVDLFCDNPSIIRWRWWEDKADQMEERDRG